MENLLVEPGNDSYTGYNNYILFSRWTYKTWRFWIMQSDRKRWNDQINVRNTRLYCT